MQKKLMLMKMITKIMVSQGVQRWILLHAMFEFVVLASVFVVLGKKSNKAIFVIEEKEILWKTCKFI